MKKIIIGKCRIEFYPDWQIKHWIEPRQYNISPERECWSIGFVTVSIVKGA